MTIRIHQHEFLFEPAHIHMILLTCDIGARNSFVFLRSEFIEPQGWYHLVLDRPDDAEAEEITASLPGATSNRLQPIDVFVLQVCILGNHLNGKDTHIRCIKIFGPPTHDAPITPIPRPVASGMRERLVQQGMHTEAFHRQVDRVGYDRALKQLERIMKHTMRSLEQEGTPTKRTAPHTLLSMSHTLR